MKIRAIENLTLGHLSWKSTLISGGNMNGKADCQLEATLTEKVIDKWMKH